MDSSEQIPAERFGYYTPGNIVRCLIRLAQRMPRNSLGIHCAHLIRSIVTRYASLPVDLDVEDLHLRCFLRDNYSEKKFVFTPWRYDGEERAYLRRRLPPDGVFLDIGANVGLYSLNALRVLDERGTLIAVEPNPAIHERLRFNLESNQPDPSARPRIHTVQAGVSDQEATLELHLHPTNLGQSSLRQEAVNETASTVSIPCRPLLTLLDELGIDHLSAIKIDIEGAEDRALMPFLASAPDSLLPGFIMMENSEEAWGQPLPEQLAERGYRCIHRFSMNSIYRRDTTPATPEGAATA